MAETILTLATSTLQSIVAADRSITEADFGLSDSPFAIHYRRLHGGLSEGVDVVEIDNGRFRFAALPTRGMGLWKGWLGDWEMGWQSPVAGPVHPQFVPLAEPGGLGWLDGFDEWLCRCGLESNGPPEFSENGQLRHPLHGKIANRPAHDVELGFDHSSGEIRVTGYVDDIRFLIRNLRLRSSIITRLGEPGLRIVDEVTNLSATPSSMQLLYHINFGAPLLEPGARVVAPVKTLVPRDATAVAGVKQWDLFDAPQPGYAEQVFFLDLHADSQQRTHVLLKDAAGRRGVSLGIDKRRLPCFTLWKNTGALSDGYVTGLEPGTNYPNPRTHEAAEGRVVSLAPGETARFELSLTLHDEPAAVAAAEAAIEALASSGKREIFTTPQPGWCAS